MEDLWRMRKAGVDVEDFADHAEYRQFLRRFCADEEQAHTRQLLYGDERPGKPIKRDNG